MSGSQANGGLGFRGFQEPNTAGDSFNAAEFHIRAVLSRIDTATLVQVKAVTNAGDVSPVGFVDILPLVNQTDGAGNATLHGTISHCPYFRLQGGTNAIILDPQVGDIGIAVFASRDISSVTANKGQANPGSRRQFDMADGLYVGGLLNATPVQYVQFNADGITVVSPTKITLKAPAVEIDASSVFTVNAPQQNNSGAITAQGDVHGDGTSLHTHVHTGVQPGTGNTGAPA